MNIFRKHSNEVEALQEQIAQMEASHNMLTASVKTLQNEITNLVARFTAEKVASEETVEQLSQEVEHQETVIGQLETVVVETIEKIETVEVKAAEKAIEIVASMGHKSPVVVQDTVTPIDILAQLKQLKGQALVDFYSKNKNEISKLKTKI